MANKTPENKIPLTQIIKDIDYEPCLVKVDGEYKKVSDLERLQKVLKKKNCSAHDFFKTFGVQKLLRAGFDAQYREIVILAHVYSLGKDSNISKAGLQKLLQDYGYTIDAFFTRYTAKDFVDIGLSHKIMVSSDHYNLTDLTGAGISIEELVDAGFSHEKIVSSKKYHITKLIRAGISINTIRNNRSYSIEAFLSELPPGKILVDLLKEKCEFEDRNLINLAIDLRDYGSSIENLKELGFEDSQIAAAGYSVDELLKLGIKKETMIIKNATAAKDLKEQGRSIEDLRKLGFDEDDIINAGFAKDILSASGIHIDTITIGDTLFYLDRAGDGESTFGINQLKEAISHCKDSSDKTDATTRRRHIIYNHEYQSFQAKEPETRSGRNYHSELSKADLVVLIYEQNPEESNRIIKLLELGDYDPRLPQGVSTKRIVTGNVNSSDVLYKAAHLHPGELFKDEKTDEALKQFCQYAPPFLLKGDIRYTDIISTKIFGSEVEFLSFVTGNIHDIAAKDSPEYSNFLKSSLRLAFALNKNKTGLNTMPSEDHLSATTFLLTNILSVDLPDDERKRLIQRALNQKRQISTESRNAARQEVRNLMIQYLDAAALSVEETNEFQPLISDTLEKINSTDISIEDAEHSFVQTFPLLGSEIPQELINTIEKRKQAEKEYEAEVNASESSSANKAKARQCIEQYFITDQKGIVFDTIDDSEVLDFLIDGITTDTRLGLSQKQSLLKTCKDQKTQLISRDLHDVIAILAAIRTNSRGEITEETKTNISKTIAFYTDSVSSELFDDELFHKAWSKNVSDLATKLCLDLDPSSSVDLTEAITEGHIQPEGNVVTSIIDNNAAKLYKQPLTNEQIQEILMGSKNQIKEILKGLYDHASIVDNPNKPGKKMTLSARTGVEWQSHVPHLENYIEFIGHLNLSAQRPESTKTPDYALNHIIAQLANGQFEDIRLKDITAVLPESNMKTILNESKIFVDNTTDVDIFWATTDTELNSLKPPNGDITIGDLSSSPDALNALIEITKAFMSATNGSKLKTLCTNQITTGPIHAVLKMKLGDYGVEVSTLDNIFKTMSDDCYNEIRQAISKSNCNTDNYNPLIGQMTDILVKEAKINPDFKKAIDKVLPSATKFLLLNKHHKLSDKGWYSSMCSTLCKIVCVVAFVYGLMIERKRQNITNALDPETFLKSLCHSHELRNIVTNKINEHLVKPDSLDKPLGSPEVGPHDGKPNDQSQHRSDLIHNAQGIYKLFAKAEILENGEISSDSQLAKIIDDQLRTTCNSLSWILKKHILPPYATIVAYSLIEKIKSDKLIHQDDIQKLCTLYEIMDKKTSRPDWLMAILPRGVRGVRGVHGQHYDKAKQDIKKALNKWNSSGKLSDMPHKINDRVMNILPEETRSNERLN